VFFQPENEKSPILKLKSFSLGFGSQVFKALGDESRLRILHLLFRTTELTITDLELILDFTQTKTARLMGVLKNAGLVQSRRQDHWVFYKIKEEAIDFLGELMVYLEKDVRLMEDFNMCKVLESNRELTAFKLASRQYQPPGFSK
jgi:DNA-binding transcriptional ArsR family regulator